MLVKEFPLETASTSNTFDSPTIYKFITIFNNSTHELTFFSDESINNRFMLFSVSPFQYVTYPLEVMGTVSSCTRLQKFTFTTIQRVVTPPFAVLNPNVRILLSEENFNVNNYQQANAVFNFIPQVTSSLDRRLLAGVLSSGVILTATSKMIINSLFLVSVGVASTVTLSHRRSGVDVRLLDSFAIPVGNTQALGYIVLESGDSLFVNSVAGVAHVSIYGMGS